MQASQTRRLLGCLIDLFILLGGLGLVFLTTTSFYRKFSQSLALVLLNQPAHMDAKFLIALFVLAPLLIFVSYVFLSASPGQYLLNLREVDASTGRGIGFVSSLVLSFALLPSCLIFNFLPQMFSLWNPQQLTLMQWLLGTKTIQLAQAKKQRTPPKMRPLWRVVPALLIALFGAFGTLSRLIFHTKLCQSGIIVGGSMESRQQLCLSLKNPESITPKNNSLESAFEKLRLALVAQDEVQLKEILTVPSQFLVKISNVKGKKLFEDLPKDIAFVRAEAESDESVLVFYHEVEGGRPGLAESFMVFAKENGEWKVDLPRFLILIKRPVKRNG